MPTYNPKDIFITRRNSSSSSFEEYKLSSSPNTYLFLDSGSNLTTVPSSSVGGSTLTTASTYPITSSWATTSSHLLMSDVAPISWGSGTQNKIIGSTAGKYIRLFASGSTVSWTVDATDTSITVPWVNIGPFSATTASLRYMKASDGNGTDVSGSSLFMCGGRGTGNAPGGDIIFGTSLKSSFTGASTRTATERFRVSTQFLNSSVPVFLGSTTTGTLTSASVGLYIYGANQNTLGTDAYNRLGIFPATGSVGGYYVFEPQFYITSSQREIRFNQSQGFLIDFGGIPGSYYSGIFLGVGVGSDPDRGFTRTTKGLACASKTGVTPHSLRVSNLYVGAGDLNTTNDLNQPTALTPNGIEFGESGSVVRDLHLFRASGSLKLKVTQISGSLIPVNGSVFENQVSSITSSLNLTSVNFGIGYHSCSLSENTQITSSNLNPGRSIVMLITAQDLVELTWPPYIAADVLPTTLDAGNKVLVKLHSFGTTEPEVVVESKLF